jgi:hypothetical protein
MNGRTLAHFRITAELSQDGVSEVHRRSRRQIRPCAPGRFRSNANRYIVQNPRRA